MRKSLPLLFILLSAFFFLQCPVLKAQYFVQDFNNIHFNQGTGWDTINRSSPIGTHAWFQGNTAIFDPQSGSGYVAADFFCTGSNGTISSWLVSPETTLHNGDIITFYTRKADSTGSNFADRLQVRCSTNGVSKDVGLTAFSVGDFTELLYDINPSYSNVGWPEGYPYTWTKFNIAVSGVLDAPAQGRIAFRYFVEDGGIQGIHSEYIGLDSVAFHPGGLGVPVIGKPVTKVSIYPNPVKNMLHIEANIRINAVKIKNVFGQVNGEFEVKKNSASINTSSYSPGMYYVTLETNQGSLSRKICITR